MDKTFMMLSIVPYLLFLYLIWRIRKLDPRLLHRTSFIGFCSMLGFVIVTAIAGTIALKVLGAETLGHVDWLHGLAESGLTIVNGLIALGLKQQKDELELADMDTELKEEPQPASSIADA